MLARHLHLPECPPCTPTKLGFATESARHVAPLILDVFEPVGSAVDLGGGTGAWLHALQTCGVRRVVLVDRPEVRDGLLVPPEAFVPADLDAGFPALGRFDVAVCVEVAEHLAAARAPALVSWLVGASDRVVFSAALPGQGGKGHVNEQPSAFWDALFAGHGFERRDVFRGALIHETRVAPWYRQNLVGYVRAGVPLSSERADFLPADFALCHTSNALWHGPTLESLSGRQWLAGFASAVGRGLRHRLAGRRA